MDILLELIFILATLKYCLKAAQTGRWYIMILYALLPAGVAVALYPWVITLPADIGKTLLSSRDAVSLTAVITTVEAVAGIFISVSLLDNYFARRERRKKYMTVLKTLPGVLMIMGVVYFELMYFRYRAGEDFLRTALLYGAMVAVGVGGVSCAVSRVVTRESMKMEMSMLLNVIILMVGLIVNSFTAHYSVSHSSTQVDYPATCVVLLMVLAGFLTGWMILPKIKNIKYIKRLKWNR